MNDPFHKVSMKKYFDFVYLQNMSSFAHMTFLIHTIYSQRSAGLPAKLCHYKLLYFP